MLLHTPLKAIKIKRHFVGFTLAELLISLAILGVIATFTIPKILTAQQNAQKNATVKEDFATVSNAFDMYKQNNLLTSNSKIAEITPYLNYLQVDTSSTLDGSRNDSLSYVCSNRVCLKLHNGSILAFGNGGSFGGNNTTNMQWFLVDPDGAYKGDSSSVWGVIYYNGRLSTWGLMTPLSRDADGFWNPGNYDPLWFSWN